MCGLILVCCRTLLNKAYLYLHVRGSASNLVPVACLDNPNRKLLTHWLLYTGLGHAGQATQVFFKSVVWMHYCSFLHVMKLKKGEKLPDKRQKQQHADTARLKDSQTNQRHCFARATLKVEISVESMLTALLPQFFSCLKLSMIISLCLLP